MYKNSNHQFVARVRRAISYLTISALSLFAVSAHAVLSVNVDDRVSVDFTPIVVNQETRSYMLNVIVTNTSPSDILSPVQFVVTAIDKERVMLSNADGITADGNPYVLVEFSGESLASGETSQETMLQFKRIKHSPHRARRHGQSRQDYANEHAASHAVNSIKYEKHCKRAQRHGHSVNQAHGSNKRHSGPHICFDYEVNGGVIAAVSGPTTSPSVLAVNSGIVDVVFKAYLEGDNSAASNLLLVRQDDGSSYPLNDDGVAGDPIADDGIYGAVVAIDTATLVAEQCIPFTSTAEVDGVIVTSAVTNLCATSFPPSAVPSNTEPSNLIVNSDGNEAVSDELVVMFVKGASEAQIVNILNIYNAEVVGTLLRYGIYQVRLSESKSLNELELLISQLKQRNAVFDAYMNTLVERASIPSDVNFGLQHGLTLINADDVWDIGATGSGVTITIVDSGVDVSHEELDAPGKVTDPAIGHPTFEFNMGEGLVDSVNHGTVVAGIAAAETDNVSGIAGVARDSLIESIKISEDESQTYVQFVNALALTASPTATGEIVNISSNAYFPPSSQADTLCQIVNDIVLDGTSTPRKIVINSAGNLGIATASAYPGLCNVDVDVFTGGGALIGTYNVTLTDKSLIIPVANSISCDTTDTTSCDLAKVDTLFSTSNYGFWVDVAAPGTYINAPQSGGGYDYGNGPDGTGSAPSDGNGFTNPAGTSFSAPMVAGAAAILRSCGVAIGDIEAALKAGTLNDVDPDVAVVLPRIDLLEALNSVNTVPSGLSIDNTAIDELASPSDTTTGPVTVGALSATDGDSCDAFTYSIAGGVDSGSFQVSGNSLEVQTGIVLDFETKNSFNVTVRVTDYFGQTFDQPLIITLNNVIDLVVVPDVTGDSQAVAETSMSSAQLVANITNEGSLTVAAGTVISQSPVAGTVVDENSSVDVVVSTGGPGAPVLVYDSFVDYTGSDGNPYRRWHFNVTNWNDYPPEMFITTTDYGPCGLNPDPSRSWVDFFDASNDSRIYGFCALGTPNNLNGIWFARSAGTPPPSSGVYIRIIDRAPGGLTYTSNTVPASDLDFP